MGMGMTTIDTPLSRLRLLQLVSPSLPVGAFTYSQGLEWAVECGWVNSETQLLEWIEDLMQTSLSCLEIPCLGRLHQACADQDDEALAHWTRYLIASRETRELREEEHNRARALARLTGFAHAAYHWGIPLNSASEAYLWGWMESMVLAGVKIVPLGQTAGQRAIAALTSPIPGMVEKGLALADDEIGASCPAQALASSLHESQYTRIYRS